MKLLKTNTFSITHHSFRPGDLVSLPASSPNFFLVTRSSPSSVTLLSLPPPIARIWNYLHLLRTKFLFFTWMVDSYDSRDPSVSQAYRRFL
jgi:hypothetical protein